VRRWVIGCTHFDDASIIRYRGAFSSLDDMNERIASSWAEQVAKDDLVYILGDFALARTTYWARRLPGTKVLVVGNHDKVAAMYTREFSEVHQMLTLRLPPVDPRDRPRQVFMCHYPFISWPGKGEGSVHLHAHSHGQGATTPRLGQGPGRIDMSVDRWSRWPVPLDEAYELGKEKEKEKNENYCHVYQWRADDAGHPPGAGKLHAG